MKEFKTCVIDTYDMSAYSVDDMESYNEDNNTNVDYQEFQDIMRDIEIEDFFYNISNSRYLYNDYLIMGSVDRWDGRRFINPIYYNNLYDAIKDCIEDCNDFKVYETNYGIEVHNMHHDGTNIYFIRLLSKKGLKKLYRLFDNVTWKEYDFLHPTYKNFNILDD